MGAFRILCVSVCACVCVCVCVCMCNCVYRESCHSFGRVCMYVFVCICKHTATRIRIWQGCPAGGRFPPGECFPALGFALLPLSYVLQSRQHPQPDPRTLDEYTPRQYWSANFIQHPGNALPATLPYCPHPNSSNLDRCALRQNWSATLDKNTANERFITILRTI